MWMLLTYEIDRTGEEFTEELNPRDQPDPAVPPYSRLAMRSRVAITTQDEAAAWGEAIIARFNASLRPNESPRSFRSCVLTE